MLKIGVMLGDDIGLEVVPETVKVMKAAADSVALGIEWQELPLGVLGHKLHGHTMPQYTVDALAKTDGFITGPIGHKSIRAMIRHGSCRHCARNSTCSRA